jgi:hypothetical protein
LAAVDVSSVKDGGSPGSNTLVASDVVVVVEDGTNVELVTSGRVVVVVLLVGLAVVDVAFCVVLVEDAGTVVAVVLEGAATTTTPVIPDWRWILQT